VGVVAGPTLADVEEDALRQQLGVEQERPDEVRPPGGAEDSGGGGRGREAAVLDLVQAELDDVEGALERLDAGTYGTCQTCGGEIGDERLAELPATRFCGEHQPGTS
jgi:RNA polymerase-binding transcription factor DksA